MGRPEAQSSAASRMARRWASVRERGAGQKGLQALPPEDGAGGPLPPGAEKGQAAGEVEELLKDEPPPGQGQGLLRGGKVDVLIGVAAGGQGVGLPHPEGEDLRHRLGAVLNAPEGEPREQVIGDPRRQGVDGHDPPGEAGAVLRLKDRVGHAPAGGQALHHAIEDIALPWDQGIFHIALVEERELHGAAGVHYPRLGQLQPLADIGAAGGSATMAATHTGSSTGAAAMV